MDGFTVNNNSTEDKRLFDRVFAIDDNYNFLKELTTSEYHYDEELDDFISTRDVEDILFREGNCVCAYDDIQKQYVTLPLGPIYKWNYLGHPEEYDIISRFNDYRLRCNKENSFIIWDSDRVTFNGKEFCIIANDRVARHYAERIADVQGTESIQTYNQRRLKVFKGNKNQVMALKNICNKLDSFDPVAIVDNTLLDMDNMQVYDNNTPYNIDLLQQHQQSLVNEYLTKVGIPNQPFQKSERMLVNESELGEGSTTSIMYARLKPRHRFVKWFNERENTNIEVHPVHKHFKTLEDGTDDFDNKECEDDACSVHDKVEDDT